MDRAIGVAAWRKLKMLFAKMRCTRTIGIHMHVGERQYRLGRIRKYHALAEGTEQHEESQSAMKSMHGEFRFCVALLAVDCAGHFMRSILHAAHPCNRTLTL